MRQRLDVGCSLLSSDLNQIIFLDMLCRWRDGVGTSRQGRPNSPLL